MLCLVVYFILIYFNLFRPALFVEFYIHSRLAASHRYRCYNMVKLWYFQTSILTLSCGLTLLIGSSLWFSALTKIIKTGFSAINLIYFFTAGPDEPERSLVLFKSFLEGMPLPEAF